MGGYPLKDRKNLKKTIRDLATNKTADDTDAAKLASGDGAPDANLDINDGIVVGTIYVDTETGALYTCTDNTATKAVWATVGGSSDLWRWGGLSIVPTVLVANGLAVDVGAAPGSMIITVADYVPVVKSSDQNITPAFGIAIAGSPKPTMYEDPLAATLLVDCESLGTILVDIWIEESGNPQNVFTNTYLIVSDEANVCNPE